jgi:hypothetical protein
VPFIGPNANILGLRRPELSSTLTIPTTDVVFDLVEFLGRLAVPVPR